MTLNRRQFLKGASAVATFPILSQLTHSQNLVSPTKTVVHIFLEGGPDFRHLIAPQPSSDYGSEFWKARASIFEIDGGNIAGIQKTFDEHYDLINFDSMNFGLLKKASWLKTKIQEGKVAIINNVVGSTSRDHPYSSLIWGSGDSDAQPQELCRSGWGGRLASYANKRIMSVTEQPLLFCNGPHPSNPLAHANTNLVDVPNIENFSFTKKSDWILTSESLEPEHAVFRSLKNYYRLKRSQILSGTTFASFVETEEVIRSLGDQIENRLKNEINPAGGYLASFEDDLHSFEVRRPLIFEQLLRGENKAFFESFAMQLLNTYYGIACQDILETNVISLMLEGFDTHAEQRHEQEGFEIRIEELLGSNKGLDLLDSQLLLDYPLSRDNLIYVLGGEFGRQLKSNGASGTDHGHGNSLLIIGEQVTGGIYGDLFPESEISIMQEWNQHIDGKTSFEKIFATIADWACAGAGAVVFPSHHLRPLENENVLAFL